MHTNRLLVATPSDSGPRQKDLTKEPVVKLWKIQWIR